MPEDETGIWDGNPKGVFHLPPAPETLPDEPGPEYAWSRKWVIINTLGTLLGAVTGIVALVIAVIALTS